MKKLKSLFRKIKAKKTLKTYQKPLLVTILTLLVINIVVLLVGALVGLILDKNYYDNEFFGGNYLVAIIGAVKWMISPNSLTALDVHDYWVMMILAVVIIIVGMVLFSGAIVATVTTALRSYIDTKSRAKGKILVNDHFVILNWNNKVPDMIYNLMLKGFKNNIVILSSHNKEYIESEIKSLFLTNDVDQKYKANLIVKEGDSLLRGNLEDISIENASQICIMARDDMVDVDDDNIINSDLLNLKIVLRLGSFNIRKDCQIVVETDSDETRGQIENISFTVSTLKPLTIIPVSFNKKIGQIIAQSLVVPLMSGLYNELFSFEGAEFYSLDSKLDIDAFLKEYNEAIPVYKDNRLFVLADTENDTLKKREKPYTTTRKFETIQSESVKEKTIFVIGNNSKKEFLMENLERSKAYGDIDFSMHTYEKTENEKLINDIKNTAGLKEVLILSDDQVQPESYDANVFVTLIELSKAFPNRDNLVYITELLDSRNLSSVRDFNIHNTIISNKMMSLLITQLALTKDSKVFFDKILKIADISRQNDFDLLVSKIGNMIKIEEPLEFANKGELLRTFYNTYDGEKILIGLYQNKELKLLNKEQDKSEKIIINKDDSFVYFSNAR